MKKPPQKLRWTDEEVSLLRTYYGTIPAKQLQTAYLPKRTLKAIEIKAGKLGIAAKSPPRAKTKPAKQKQPWTQKELAILRELYDTMPAAELRQNYLPNRTERSIRQQAYMQQAQNRPSMKWSDDELKTLTSKYGTMPTVQLQKKFLPNRSRQAIENQLTKLGIQRVHHPSRNNDSDNDSNK